MFCAQCGCSLPDDAVFCARCGQPTGFAQAPNPAASGAGAAMNALPPDETALEIPMHMADDRDETTVLAANDFDSVTTVLAADEFDSETTVLPDCVDGETRLLTDEPTESETTLLPEEPSEAETALLGDSNDSPAPSGDTPTKTQVSTADSPTGAPHAQRRPKFQRTYDLPDSALEPQTKPVTGPQPAVQPGYVPQPVGNSQPIYIMPVVANQTTGSVPYVTGSLAPVSQPPRKKSHAVPLAIIGAALGVALAVFIAFQMGLVGGVKIPDVTGLSPDNATQRLKDAGLEVTTHEELVDQGAGVVVSLEPAASTSVSKGTTVDIGIGAERRVPDVFGINVDDATKKLIEAGALNITIEHRFSDAYEEGTVISVNPAPGNRFNAHDDVTLVVAQEP